jgi:AcrR family transcriptional regulator
MAELSAERGYEATKIGELVRRAGVARKTLYDNFDGKEEVFLAALDEATGELFAQVEAACAASGGEWRDRVAAGLRAFLAYVAENPAAARMLLVEAASATPTAFRRYEEASRRGVELLERNAPAGAGLPGTIAEALVGGVAWIVHGQVRSGAAAQALDLTPELVDFILSPYQGVAKSRG